MQQNDFTVVIEADGANAVERICNEQADCVLLDIMLPNKDGFAICKEVQMINQHDIDNGYDGPILILTARDEDIDQLLGLELGADDYIAKPVQPRLLLARIHALLRRMNQRANSFTKTLTFGDLIIESVSRRVLLNNQVIDMSTAEFDLLYLLAKNAGVVLSRDDILQHLRGIGYDGTDRSIDLRVSRLRKKLQDESISETQRIKTVRGRGYLFALFSERQALP